MADNRRKRRSGGFVDVLAGLLSILVIGLIVGVVAFGYGVWMFGQSGPLPEERTFLVEQNSGLGIVAQRLESQGIISNAMVFQAFGRGMDRQGSLKPGEFLIPANASMGEILDLLTQGRPIEYFVTVPEGETSWQVVQRLNDPSQNLTGDPITAIPAEGSILPGRYDYFPRATRESVLATMQANMTAKVEEVWANCSPRVCGEEGVLTTQQELVTLASIVEEETGIATERPIVAGLFVNRLDQGMRLQTDPTIIYGITRGQTQLEGGITASQKAEETDYNTYVIDGLPPTPISNPGVEALEAAANPADTDFLYMMAVTPGNYRDGHYFAATYEEHQANERRYRTLEQQAEEAPAP